jgi:cation diffusion facilitator family transporter
MLGSAERITIVSIIVTTLLGTVGISLSLMFGVVAFLAAGIDAIFDTLTSIGVLAGLRVSKRPADRGHLYGHMQAETLVSIFLAVALVFSALRIEFLALDKIFYQQTQVEVTLPLFLVAALSILIFGVLAMYKIKIGRLTKRNSVVADGYHTLSDSFSSAMVLVGLVMIQMGYPWMDTVAAIVISFIILRWGFIIGYDSLNVLMGASPGEKFMSEVKEICRDTQGVKGFHKCRARRVGSRVHADLHVQVDPKLSVEESHEVASRVERSLKAKIPDLASVVVHIEPSKERKNAKKRSGS